MHFVAPQKKQKGQWLGLCHYDISPDTLVGWGGDPIPLMPTMPRSSCQTPSIFAASQHLLHTESNFTKSSVRTHTTWLTQ